MIDAEFSQDATPAACGVNKNLGGDLGGLAVSAAPARLSLAKDFFAPKIGILCRTRYFKQSTRGGFP
jgi:hypothetical protein